MALLTLSISSSHSSLSFLFSCAIVCARRGGLGARGSGLQFGLGFKLMLGLGPWLNVASVRPARCRLCGLDCGRDVVPMNDVSGIVHFAACFFADALREGHCVARS